MDEVKVFYDEQGRTLAVWSGRSSDGHVFEETGEEKILMEDRQGHVIGFDRLGFVADPRRLHPNLEAVVA